MRCTEARTQPSHSDFADRYAVAGEATDKPGGMTISEMKAIRDIFSHFDRSNAGRLDLDGITRLVEHILTF